MNEVYGFLSEEQFDRTAAATRQVEAWTRGRTGVGQPATAPTGHPVTVLVIGPKSGRAYPARFANRNLTQLNKPEWFYEGFCWAAPLNGETLAAGVRYLGHVSDIYRGSDVVDVFSTGARGYSGAGGSGTRSGDGVGGDLEVLSEAVLTVAGCEIRLEKTYTTYRANVVDGRILFDPISERTAADTGTVGPFAVQIPERTGTMDVTVTVPCPTGDLTGTGTGTVTIPASCGSADCGGC